MGFLKKIKKAVRKVVKIAAPIAAGFIPGGTIALQAGQAISARRTAQKAARREKAQYARAERAAAVPDMVEQRMARRRVATSIRYRRNAANRQTRRARRVSRSSAYRVNTGRAPRTTRFAAQVG